MNKRLKDVIAPRAEQIIQGDKPLVDHFKEIDNMIELKGVLPKELTDKKWMREVKATDFLNAILTGRRTLATIEPIPFIQPLNSNIVTKKLANQNERNLMYQLRYANKKSDHDIVGDIVESALRYDMVAAFVVPCKWQIEGVNGKGNKKGFFVNVENPRTVHSRRDGGELFVIHEKVMRARDAVKFYGDNAKELAAKIKDETKELYVTVWDQWGDERATWCSAPTESAELAIPTSIEYVFLEPQENELDFNPWVIEKGGTSLSMNTAHSLRPMLGPAAHAKMYELATISKSLAFAEAVAYSAAPRWKIVSYAEDSVRIDYGDVNTTVDVKPGEDIIPLQPPAMDENVLGIYRDLSNELDQQTGIKNLASMDVPSGTAYATVNSLLKAATASLDPFKRVAEKAIGSAFEKMLLWTEYTKEPMVGYGSGETDMGQQYELKPEWIDPDEVDVTVTLTPHLPTDKIQRINAAVLLNKELGYPKEEAYKEFDVPDPERIIQLWEQEQIKENELAQILKMRNAETDLQIQQQQMAMQMQAQQAMQPPSPTGQSEAGASRGRVLQARAGDGRAGPPREEAQAAAALKGPGFNPNQGGESPNVGAPDSLLFEKRTGRTRSGESIDG